MARILVIDDHLHICTIIKNFLELGQHTVDMAENGRVGLTLAETNVYDLVITDIVMPERDGLEVITELKKFFPQVRVIGMTGGAARHDIGLLLRTARVMGADRILAKPLDFMMLQAEVNELLALER